MQIEIAKHARMSERGSSLLRLIQNNDMPILDLLVREAVQNSLDASLPGKGFTNVDFNIVRFDCHKLSSELEGITENLNAKYKDSSQLLIEVRDTNTSGLTGPIQYDEVRDNQFGNLLKLIYEISMPQQQEGAGGSWGLGKTVYFRIGIGLVLYYSQIESDDGSYVSRMAACLVEDENKIDALINNTEDSLKRGIAWWGQGTEDGMTMPLTNENEIRKILNILNVEPFENGQTGTSIIIPFIDSDTLLAGILPSNGSEENKEFSNIWWLDDVKDYIKLAVQRWYAPRLMNQNYQFGRWLRVRINGEGIKHSDMLPFFKIVQGLYNATPISQQLKENETLLDNCDVLCEEVKLRNIFDKNTCAGYIAYAKVTRDELLMNYPDNHQAPYIYINKFDYDQNVNHPILMYTRKPGMIVGYEISGCWTDSIPKTDDGEFIVGLFVANSSNKLMHTTPSISLEEYIRKSEKADHTSWNDWNVGIYKPSIIAKIQGQVKAKMAKQFMKTETENLSRRNIGLQKVLAEVLLPPENFGRKASVNHHQDKETDIKSISKGFGVRVIDSPLFKSDGISLDFEINCGKKVESLLLELVVKTESGIVPANKWEDEGVIGKSFPVTIKTFLIDKYKTGKQAPPFKPNGLSVGYANRECSENGVIINLENTERFNVDYGVVIQVPEKTGYTIYGTIVFEVKDSQVQAGLNLVEAGGAY